MLTSEGRKKIADALRGKPKSPEHKQKMREARLGKTYEDLFGDRADEERQKRGAHTRGKTYEQIYGEQAQEQRDKRSGERNGNVGRVFSEDERKRRSARLSGWCWSEGQRARRGPGFHQGSKNPNWKGGTSSEEYCFEWTEDLKNSIRQRDNTTCRWCGRTTEEEGRQLCVHHIDYDKVNTETSNLITLCNSCHAKTNGIRLLWLGVFSLLRFQSARKPDSYLFEGWLKSVDRIRKINDVGFGVLSEKE